MRRAVLILGTFGAIDCLVVAVWKFASEQTRGAVTFTLLALVNVTAMFWWDS